MESLTNRKKPVERKPMTFWEKMYLPSIAKGMGITMSHFFKKKPTINYPEEKRPFSTVFRGLQILNRDEEGRERCTRDTPEHCGDEDVRADRRERNGGGRNGGQP